MSASGLPVLLRLPSIVPEEFTLPLSFKIGPVSALAESFRMAFRSEESDVLIWCLFVLRWYFCSCFAFLDEAALDCATAQAGIIKASVSAKVLSSFME